MADDQRVSLFDDSEDGSVSKIEVKHNVGPKMAIAARAKSPCMACTMAKNPANNAAVVNRLGST